MLIMAARDVGVGGVGGRRWPVPVLFLFHPQTLFRSQLLSRAQVFPLSPLTSVAGSHGHLEDADHRLCTVYVRNGRLPLRASDAHSNLDLGVDNQTGPIVEHPGVLSLVFMVFWALVNRCPVTSSVLSPALRTMPQRRRRQRRRLDDTCPSSGP
ncbi:hypothetical protein B0H16DRAFT_1532760 [Mycena metata]|uniref:Uncharacterized protein n=1 Tax=Mycena metata TaxID=1033252 RepID=A0AAD7JA88_9AGAR|nr:hypothetical protein B0H16DRAFT_1532760 [Mycena metata]